MRDETASVIQTVSGIMAVVMITIAALATQPSNTHEVWLMIGSAFTVIAGLLGVDWGVRVVRNGNKEMRERADPRREDGP